MTPAEERRYDDAAQMAAIDEWNRRQAEKRLARQIAHDELILDAQQAWYIGVGGIVVTLLGFAAAVGSLACLVVAWNTTDDDRFLWLLAVVGTAEVVGYSFLFRKPTGRAS